MIATRTTANATEHETELARAVDDARATAEAYQADYETAAARWSAAVRERQRRWRRAYTPQQQADRAAAEEAERQAYTDLHRTAKDVDAAHRLRNEAIDRHERHAYPPDDRTRPTYANTYAHRANTLTAGTNNPL